MTSFTNTPSNTPAIRRSRLAKQENRKLVRQTISIVAGIIIFFIFFFTVGIRSLINLAVVLGNSKTSKITQQEDKIAPLPPQINPLPEATASSTITIEGSAEIGSTISLYRESDKIDENLTDSQGNFSFSNVTLSQGQNSFSATAADIAGNQSQKSVVQFVMYTNEPPKLTIDQPKDGDRVFGTLKQLITISGTTDPNAIVTVNDRQLVVKGDGGFSSKYELQDGDNKLTFTATDHAGNQTTQELTVNFSK